MSMIFNILFHHSTVFHCKYPSLKATEIKESGQTQGNLAKDKDRAEEWQNVVRRGQRRRGGLWLNSLCFWPKPQFQQQTSMVYCKKMTA